MATEERAPEVACQYCGRIISLFPFRGIFARGWQAFYCSAHCYALAKYSREANRPVGGYPLAVPRRPPAAGHAPEDGRSDARGSGQGAKRPYA